MSQRTGRQTAFLRFLFLADKTQRKQIIEMASEEQMKVLHGSSDHFRLLSDKTQEI